MLIVNYVEKEKFWVTIIDIVDIPGRSPVGSSVVVVS